MTRTKILVALSFLTMVACTQKPAKKAVKANENPIVTQLKSIKGQGMLFGHQDDLAYGMGWSYVDGESDVKRVSGDYPSLIGWELGGIELEHEYNLDSVPFQQIAHLALKAHNMGGINTFSWHPFSAVNGESSWNTETIVVKNILEGGSYHKQFLTHLDRLADYFHSLKLDDGTAMPFIFRPWHEMDGSWFWWGQKFCSHEEFKALFRLTVEYLRNEKDVKMMTVAYSPDRNFNTTDEYLTWYPGDNVVDIMGVDNYYDFKQEEGELEVIRKLHMVIEVAKKKNKLAAFTETGSSNVPDSLWFTQKLGRVVKDSIISKELSYVMVWRNDPKVHFFFPYPGHPAAADANTFLSWPGILLLNEFNQIKNDNTKN